MPDGTQMKNGVVGVRWGKGYRAFSIATQYAYHFALRLDETSSKAPSMRMFSALW
jgi:hypothetical protein